MRVEPFRAASRADRMKVEIALAGVCVFVLPHLAFAQAVPIAIVPTIAPTRRSLRRSCIALPLTPDAHGC